jgi:tetratricopeptide (TPR) repeat protein
VPLAIAAVFFCLAAPATPQAAMAEAEVTIAALRDDAVGPRAFVDDDIEYQTLVSRVQELLAELGLYDGRVDGKEGPATERAIRLYESQTQLPVVGHVSRQLLEHIESVGLASRLVRRIEASRGRAIENARAALAQNNATRSLLERTSLPVADPTRDGATCLRSPTVSCLLSEAFESTKAVADVKFRDWILGDIATALARSGRADAALDTLRFVEDPRLILTGLRAIAAAQAEAGSAGEATLLAGTIPDEWLQAEAISAIAVVDARDRRFDRLLHLVDRVMDIAHRGGDDLRAASILARLGSELVRLGADKQARRLADAVRTLAELPGRSRATKDRLASELATVLAELGERDAAANVLSQIKDDNLRRPALQALALDYASARDFDAARRVLKEIIDPRYRATSLANVAFRQAQLGDPTGAAVTAREAIDESATIPWRFAYAKGFVLSRIVRANIEIREIASAGQIAAGIADPALRTQSQLSVAAAVTDDRAAVLAQARESASKIVTDVDRVWAYSGAALSASRAGQRDLARIVYDEAVANAQSITAAFARATALTRLANTLLEFRDASR